MPDFFEDIEDDNEEISKALADIIFPAMNLYWSKGPTGQRRDVKKEVEIIDATIHGVKARAKAATDLVTNVATAPIDTPLSMLGVAVQSLGAVTSLPFSKEKSKQHASKAGAAACRSDL